tara:strand:+ start:585 stop:761 length:177 start_codon:yes stop_codon:yes gene_type:complete
MKEEIKEILIKALDIERWAPKTNATYPFLEEEEKEEMVNNILKEMEDKGYKIIKKEIE